MLIYNTLIGRSVNSTKAKMYKQWYYNNSRIHYKYYLLDRTQYLLIPFQTKEELKAYAEEYNIFDYINITGKDTYYDNETNCYYLRPYQVFDDTGKIINIRDWNFPTDKNCIHRPISFYNPNNAGKRHNHRISGPSMYKRELETQSMPYAYDDNYTAIIRKPKTHISKADMYRYYEKSYANDYKSSKCWKDQCKCRKQYGRHQSNHMFTSKMEDIKSLITQSSTKLNTQLSNKHYFTKKGD